MSGLRVISGKARGRKLRHVPGDTTRPITDRVKEALFSIIGADINGSAFLDLFAGTGSVGIEALSRGAELVRFVEKNHRAAQVILENLKATSLTPENSNKPLVIRADVFQFIERQADCSFDYIYIAPPQYKSLWILCLEKLDLHLEWLSADGWIIVQIHPIEYAQINFNFLEEFDTRRYGSTILVFYRRKEVNSKQLENRSL